MKKEIEECYKLIHRLGRGVAYLGSSRMGPNHPHYTQAFELGREVEYLRFLNPKKNIVGGKKKTEENWKD